METIEEVINRPENPEYILLEASGVADPSGIAMTFAIPNFRDRIRLDSIISIVDTEQVFANADNPYLSILKLQQIGFSDMVILNKVDLVNDEQLQRVKDWINSKMRRVRMVESIPNPNQLYNKEELIRTKRGRRSNVRGQFVGDPDQLYYLREFGSQTWRGNV